MGDDGKDIRAYFVSIDPSATRPEVMGTYVGNFSDASPPSRRAGQGLRHGQSFGIYWKMVPTDDGDYTMDHTASVLLLNGKGEFAGTIAYGENADARWPS